MYLFKVFIPFTLLSGVLVAQQPTPPPTTGRPTPPPTTGQPTAPPTQRGFNFPTPFMQQPTVANSLNLTPAQQQQLGTFNQKFQGEWRDRFNKTWNSTDPDRAANLQQLQSQFNQEWMRGSQALLTDPQRTRFNQLQLQSQGPAAFFDPGVQRRLNLSDPQLAQMRDFRTQFERQSGTFNSIDPTRRDQAIKRWDTFQKESAEKIRGILNEQQLKTWNELIGQPVQFAAPFANLTTTPQP